MNKYMLIQCIFRTRYSNLINSNYIVPLNDFRKTTVTRTFFSGTIFRSGSYAYELKTIMYE